MGSKNQFKLKLDDLWEECDCGQITTEQLFERTLALFDSERADWKKKVEGLRGIAEHHAWEQMRRQSWGYEKALDDVLDLLKEV